MFEEDLSEIANEILHHKPMKEYCDKDRFEMYTLGFTDGYNKANEWHKVKNILPPMDEVVYLWHGNERFPVCAYRHIPYGKTEKDWVWECYWGSGYTVTQSVAKDYWWKEIVLPKESK